MSLNVYLTREEIPNNMVVIDSNDIYFNGYTNIGTSEFEKSVLKKIDNASRISDYKFLGRTEELGNFNKSCLSTGTKTLLNIYNNSDYCFNVLECGDNALEFLCDLKEGNILWEFPYFNIERESEYCDIQCRGKHFDNIVDFIEFGLEER